ncbi:MAG: MarR family EPS-associated transcriptional regulator [Pelagibacteraceae bacterium]|nr:MarR family EPS-associated transcriptional regulator [Pelagibacteraceae bacterium]PPR51260.1 MAG: hypothetical protein CFH20_00686 [Alphaproteobacteria bacterium MarineAlpha5_Bin10]|tara:strand:- start:1431 stop:1796 length:366 start_codon:yes stop_codon:yes gene_type:complete
MPQNKDSMDDLNLLRKIQTNPEASQRELAKELGFSLGKVNYCLTALKAKGLIKLDNFRKNNNKLNYFYILTPKGFVAKTKLTLRFMKIKMQEYDELQAELETEKILHNKKNKNNNKKIKIK